MSSFFRFPHTPHLAWLGEYKPREDKVLDAAEVRALLSNAVTLEEKVDGANLGLSVDDHGALRGQNRGSYLDLDSLTGQWKPLKRWLAPRRFAIADALGTTLVLFGEWCYAVHSVRYTRLPDWFLVFDVYDRARNVFWSVDRRAELAKRLGLSVVPEVARGRFALPDIEARLGASALGDAPAEGLYIRRDGQGHLRARAKLVRAEFVHNIDEHWSKRPLETNQLARTTE